MPTQNISQPLPPVLAKDRYYLSQQAKKLAKYPNPKIQAAFEQKLAYSVSMVAKRAASVPLVSLNDDLPVSQQAEKLIKAIQDHQVIIVAGETGSGKTTQLPKIALLAGRGRTGQIGHTQPRRLAARSVATRIAEELDEKLGKTISFKVRFNEVGNQHSLIKLMTDGILLAELGRDRFLTAYDTLIIDEAHERSLNIDFILGVVKNLLPKRPDLKVIITSATLDTQRFSDYFATTVKGQIKPAPVFNVEGRSYPVAVRYYPVTDVTVISSDDDNFDDVEDNLPRAITSAVEACYQDATAKGHPEQADMLIFAATEAEIRDISEILETYAPKHTQVLPLFARQSFAEQQQIFNPSGGRRIIVATNVAETALTVPNIRYVIDLGFARISRYSYRSRVQRLPIEAISQAAANQRMGRCGRVAAGVCIRLYSEEDFNARPEFTEPEIKRTNLAQVVLQMANLRLGKVEDFDFIDPPDYRLVKDGYKLLNELGALTPTGRLTSVGKHMAKMPIDPRLARMILAGSEFACLKPMLIIVAALAVQDARERPSDKQQQADQKHALFKADDSDFLFYLNLWQAVFAGIGDDEDNEDKLSHNQRKAFAKKHYLSYPRLREWQKTHNQLTDLAKELKLSWQCQEANTKVATTHYENLHRALLTGLLSFIAQKHDAAEAKSNTIKSRSFRGEYLAARQHKSKIFPASTLFKHYPNWVMAFEMVETSQVFMRCVAKIEPEWILSAAGDLLKYHYFEPHWSKKTGHVQAYAQISLFGLIVVAKQKVNYEQINLETSHEIFLQDALVAGQLGINAPFLTHNLNKIKAVERIEDKLRRRDLLVDELALYQFYEAKVPTHIASRKAFEDWRKDIEKKAAKALFFTDEDVIAQADFQYTEQQAFPNHWQVGNVTLPLTYIFDPSHEDDGVTISVPLAVLPQLDAMQILWGIAGWRLDLVRELLKTLPKDYRRQIVPIPDTAQRIFDQLNSKGKPVTTNVNLLAVLCDTLASFGVTGIQPSDFNPQNIPNYLKPQIRLLDSKKRLIEKGRDIDTLKARNQIEASQPIITTQGLHTVFPEHYQFEAKKHMAGVALVEYQALVADKHATGVNIHHFTDKTVAMANHRKGVLTLIKRNLGVKEKQLTKQISKALQLAYAPLGKLDSLKLLLLDATLDATLATCAKDKLPVTVEAFEQTKMMVLAHFLSVGQTVLASLTQTFSRWQRIRQLMLGFDLAIFGENIKDIEDQLDDFYLQDFIYRMDYAHWQMYPRYLEALEERLNRLVNNLEKDTAAVHLLDKHMERLAGRASDLAIADYRWLVEEYRISLFAQPMKTKQPVSEKRLEKVWEQLVN